MSIIQFPDSLAAPSDSKCPLCEKTVRPENATIGPVQPDGSTKLICDWHLRAGSTLINFIVRSAVTARLDARATPYKIT